ncbi:MAG: TerB family tellurite resistance protein [Candidatus Poseidoniales archaeon]|nr:MAG: TerB family tellurite resistance protein [Candidatus Poseidoniales archaeon]
MVDGFLGTLTTEERTLLHLFDNILPEGNWEAPNTITQAGISAAVHVQRKHVPRTLKKLEKNSDLTTGQRHVPGARQKRRVYGLTPSGRERAGELRERILSELVIRNGEKVTLSSLRKGGQMTLELISHVDEGMVFHDSPVTSPVSNPEGVASLDAQAGEDLVRRMLARAWEDGKITNDEQQLITEVVNFVGMHPDRVRRLSDEARRAQNAPPPEEVYLDMLRQALIDGEIMQDEIALLTTMREAFGIDLETHEKLVAEAILDPALDDATKAYRASLETALEDGMITPDEDAILATLRTTLDIPESRHATLLAEILDRDD